MGRPSSYSRKRAEAVFALMRSGSSTSQALVKEGIARSMWMRWLRNQEVWFRDEYAKARSDLLEYWSDQIIAICDDDSRDYQPDGEGGVKSDNTSVQRDKLKIDTRKWLMSKLAPKVYGEKVTQEHTGADGTPFQPILNISVKTKAEGE